MVEKILNKDKNYNLSVAKVSEKEIKIDVLKDDISKLEEEYKNTQKDCNIYT